jgi:hypothetical protein
MGDTGMKGYAAITVNFNKPIEPTSAKSAFTISPAVPGHVSFNANYTQLIFTPDFHYTSATEYTVTVDTTAKSTNLRRVVAPFTFHFTTEKIDTTGPKLIHVSPQNGGTSIPKSYVEFILNRPIRLDSIASHIGFVDSTGKSMSFSVFFSKVTTSGLTFIAVHPTLALTRGMRYTVTLEPGMTDYYGIESTLPISTTFTVDRAEASGGTVIEGFESSLGTWIQPVAGEGTSQVDSSTTGFSTAYMGYDGFQAGELNYQFDSTGGLCTEENSQGYDISGSGSFGMWVFGDNSGNELDFVFGTPPEKFVPIDTINWYGYKFVGMWRNPSDSSTDLFRGFAVRQLQTSLLDSSTIYVDDIQIDGEVTGVHENNPGLPTSFDLAQNYPNPFNPTTVINYSLAKSTHVMLRVYDSLGRDVLTLVNQSQSAGKYSVTFSGRRLPSGLYFYRIEAGRYTATKKMMVVK